MGRKIRFISASTVVVIFFACGLFLFFGVDFVLKKLIDYKLVISPGSTIFNNWQNASVPIYLHIFLFNCTNSEDVVNFQAKPKLQQLGPYIFKERRVKVDIKWHDNDTVSFNETRTWFFDYNNTNGSLDDLITNLNVPVIAAVHMARNRKQFLNFIISEALVMLGENVFTTRTAREWLFDGFNSSFIDFAVRLNWSVPYDKFGWMYKKNDTNDGRYSVFTGRSDISLISEIDTWMGKRDLPYWKDECTKIRGTIGEIWPPHSPIKKSITLFSSDLRRSISLGYKGQIDVGTLPGLRYAISSLTLGNSSVNPANKCYEKGQMSVSGVFDESSILDGTPMYVSFPHFYLGDPSLWDAVEGLNPNQREHDTYIIIEPKTGLPLSVAARFQINVQLDSLPGIVQFNRVPKLIMPMVWFSESANLDGKTRSLLVLITQDIPHVSSVTAISCLCIGGVLMIIIGIWGFMTPAKPRHRRRRRVRKKEEDMVIQMRSN